MSSDSYTDSEDSPGYEYQPLSQFDMDEYLADENKFRQLPWEDAM